MKYKGYIYCIRNKINNKKYIGKTSQKGGYKERWSRHKSYLKYNKHNSKNLQKDYNKYGLEIFEFIILDEFTFYDEELLERVLIDMERFYINLWNTENDIKGYNDPKAKDNKRVLCVETGKIFNSGKDVIKKMFNGKGHFDMISKCCLGKRKSAFGYHFKYIDE